MYKIKVIRVITDSRVLPWHLAKTLDIIKNDYEVYVVGNEVTKYDAQFSDLNLINITIEPKISFCKDVTAFISLVFLLIKLRPDIIHSIMPKAGFITSLASFLLVPVRIHTFTGQVWQTKNGVSRFILKSFDKVVVKLNTLCLTDSVSQSEFLYAENVRTRDGKPLPVLLKGSLGGVNLEVFDINKKEQWRNEIRIEHNISIDDFVIGFLARKTKDKGALLMLEAFATIRDNFDNVKLFFVGPDDSAGLLEEYKKNNPLWGLSVVEIDSVTSHHKFLAAFDLLCLPSQREGFGSIVIDAAAMGVPAVASRISGLVDAIVDKETGLLFDVGNKQELINSIKLLIQNSELKKNLSKSAYIRTVANFSHKQLAYELDKMYKELFSNGNPPTE